MSPSAVEINFTKKLFTKKSELNFKSTTNLHFLFYFFRPAGWDNEKKVAILYENMHSMRPDQYFTDVIAKPIVRKSTNNRDIEITAEDEQQFLLRQQQYLQQGNPTAGK